VSKWKRGKERFNQTASPLRIKSPLESAKRGRGIEDTQSKPDQEEKGGEGAKSSPPTPKGTRQSGPSGSPQGEREKINCTGGNSEKNSGKDYGKKKRPYSLPLKLIRFGENF